MRRIQSGQTLVEVLVTLLFIAVSVIALIRFQNYLTYHFSLTEKKADATILAEKQIEILRDFQVLNNTAGYTSYQSLASGASTSIVNNTTYTITWTVTTNATPAYKTINVTVTWTDRYSNSNTIQLVSEVAGIEPATSSTIM